MRLTTLGGNDTALTQSSVQKLKVWLLEQALGGTVGVAAVGDDHVELALLVVQKLEAVANVDLDRGVLEANRHAGQVFLAQPDHGLIDIAQNSLLDALVLDDLAKDTTITASDDQDLLGVGVRVHGEVGDHLLVGELVALGALDHIVEHQHHAVVGGLEDEHILVLGLFVVDHLVDLQSHVLTRPHVGDLAEPSICLQSAMRRIRLLRGTLTLDGGVRGLAHCASLETAVEIEPGTAAANESGSDESRSETGQL